MVLGEKFKCFFFICDFIKLFGFFTSGHQCSNTELTSITPNTRITSITGNFDYPYLSDVEKVHIYNATVTFIPDLTLVTRQFPKFKQLFITDSGLKYVERRQLASMLQLTKLSLHRNLIELLPEDAFSDLVNLENLNVGDNKIKVLPPKLLWNLTKLKIFGADDNQIELIPRDLFKNNRELTSIWINDNKITRIEADFTLLPKLGLLNLNSNTCINEDCKPCEIERLREIQQKINRSCNSNNGLIYFGRF
jgi:Leucine-rich repeat (LRR) protein